MFFSMNEKKKTRKVKSTETEEMGADVPGGAKFQMALHFWVL